MEHKVKCLYIYFLYTLSTRFIIFIHGIQGLMPVYNFRHKWSTWFNASVYSFDIHGAQGLMTLYIFDIHGAHG